jgi:hypothetical protein
MIHPTRARRAVSIDKVGHRCSLRHLLMSIFTGSGNHSIQFNSIHPRRSRHSFESHSFKQYRSNILTISLLHNNQDENIRHLFATRGWRCHDCLRRTWPPCASQRLAREAIARVHGQASPCSIWCFIVWLLLVHYHLVRSAYLHSRPSRLHQHHFCRMGNCSS